MLAKIVQNEQNTKIKSFIFYFRGAAYLRDEVSKI